MFFVVLIIGVLLLIKLIIWNSDASANSGELKRALRLNEDDLSYSDKLTNVIALGAKVVDDYTEVTIIVPTKGFWQFWTNPTVRQKLKERMDNEIFQDFLKINYPNVVFSNVQITKNCLVLKGTQPINYRRRHRP